VTYRCGKSIRGIQVRRQLLDTQDLLFSDSTLTLFHRGVDEVLGFTDADGRIVTQDRKRFPSLLGLDSLQAHDAEGNDLGSFQVLDSITIVYPGDKDYDLADNIRVRGLRGYLPGSGK